MLRDKDIKVLSELKNSFTPSWVESDFIFSVMKSFTFSSRNKRLSVFKQKGYCFNAILSILISMQFMGVRSVNQLTGMVDARKDVFYRIKNNSKIYWRHILWMFCMKFIGMNTESEHNSSVKCLIFDDTFLKKTGKCIEKTSFVFDHVSRQYILGFKMLLMGFWDGVSFLPVDFSLHREKGKNVSKPYGLRKKDYRNQYSKDRNNNTPGHARAKEADTSKIVMMLNMLRRAISHKLSFDYVLTDSWFTCDALIDMVRRIKYRTVHVIGMYKNANTKFCFQDKHLTIGQIRNALGKTKRCRKLRLHYNQAIVEHKGEKLLLFFSKSGKNGKWRVILTTDISLSFVRALEIYQIRWTIEVFFKESKQLLNMGQCQSNDFDAHIADLTITLIQSILLSLRHRYDHYESKGALFEQIKKEHLMTKLNDRIWGLLIQILNIVDSLWPDVDGESLLEAIIKNDELLEKIRALTDPETLYISRIA